MMIFITKILHFIKGKNVWSVILKILLLLVIVLGSLFGLFRLSDRILVKPILSSDFFAKVLYPYTKKFLIEKEEKDRKIRNLQAILENKDKSIKNLEKYIAISETQKAIIDGYKRDMVVLREKLSELKTFEEELNYEEKEFINEIFNKGYTFYNNTSNSK